MSNFRIYFRIVGYAKPYWKHIGSSILCTMMYSLFSGASIGLFIPLLDLLFHPEKISGDAVSESFKVPFSESLKGIKQSFFDFVFGVLFSEQEPKNRVFIANCGLETILWLRHRFLGIICENYHFETKTSGGFSVFIFQNLIW